MLLWLGSSSRLNVFATYKHFLLPLPTNCRQARCAILPSCLSLTAMIVGMESEFTRNARSGLYEATQSYATKAMGGEGTEQEPDYEESACTWQKWPVPYTTHV